MNMNEAEMEILSKLVSAIEKLHAPIPLTVDLWDTKHIAAYLKRSTETVRDDIVSLPSFPRPIRLPTAGRPQALYKAREVIAWAEKLAS